MDNDEFKIRMGNIKIRGDLLHMKLEKIQKMNKEVKISKYDAINELRRFAESEKENTIC